MNDDTPLNSSELSEAKRALLEKWRRGELAATTSEAQVIPRRSERGTAPLSFAQQRLWFLDQLMPGNLFYNEHDIIPMPPLRVSVLEKALNEIVRRHEALRTTFESLNGEPRQVIAPSLELKLPVVDLRHLPEHSREAEALRLATEQAQEPFDLTRGPLTRVSLLRTGEDDYLFSLTMHHIVCDGWSMDVFFRELNVLYDAFAAGRPSPLPELPIQYADFADWQRHYLTGETLKSQLAYWRQQLADLPTLPLPTDRPRPPVQSFRGATQPFTISRQVQASLQAMCQQEQATAFMMLLTAFQVLLARYTGQDDIVVGSPIANRNRAELEPLIGFFVNMLVMRTDLSGDPTFREALKRVKEVALGAYSHQDLPFEKLVEELHPERDLSRNPLFQVIVQLFNVPGTHNEQQAEATPATGDSSPEVKNTTAKFDLRVDLWDTIEGMGGQVEYSRDLFEAATIERMVMHFQTLLEAIVENPDQRLSELRLITDAERGQLLEGWNQTETAYPGDACIHELFEEQVERTPDAVALVYADEQITYRELNERANRLAHYLSRLGVGPEALVGVCVERSVEMVVGLLGILKAGGAYLPLDPQYPKERLSFMLRDAGVQVLLTQQRLLEQLPTDSSAQVICLDTDWQSIKGEPDTNPTINVSAENLAYVIYTSGSTGIPKGVGALHQGVVRLVKETNYAELNEAEVFLQLAPLSFDASTFEVWGSLLNGARLVIPPPSALSLEELGETLQRHRVTTLWLTAGLFHQMVEHQAQKLGQVRQLLAGGDVLSVPHVEKALQALGAEEGRLINGYGPTENTTFTCCHAMSKGSKLGGSVPIGRPIANTRVYVLDTQMQPVPVGVAGELYIGGDGLARGYLNRAELTAEKFIPNPFSLQGGARLYRTGDVARYLEDGEIEFLGRIDQQVKVRGYRIELGEIEAVLLQHEAVSDAVVMAREDAGNEKHSEKRLIAYVVSHREQEPTVSELHRFMREKLPEYMRPSGYVMVEAMPLTVNGKVDRRALPAPDTTRPELEEEFAAPTTQVEEMLAGIWAEVLGLERVGIHDNFFELGGHSLLATQLASRVHHAFQIELPLRAIFERPTVTALAESVNALKNKGEGFVAPPITRRSRESYRVEISEGGALKYLKS